MSDKPSVLFVCVHNAGRSQMAAAYLTALAGDRVEVRSAGSAPANTVNACLGSRYCKSTVRVSVIRWILGWLPRQPRMKPMAQ